MTDNATAVLLMAMGWALGTVARQGLRMQRIRQHNDRIDAGRAGGRGARSLKQALDAEIARLRAERDGGGPVGRV